MTQPRKPVSPPHDEPESERRIDEGSAEWQRLVIRAQHGMELEMAAVDAGEFPLPQVALDQLPQSVLEEIFVAQRELLAELQRLRDENQRLRADAESPAPVHREEGKG